MTPTLAPCRARNILARLGACSGPGSAMEWVGDRTPAAAWAQCERADWMLWLLGRVAGGEDESPERKKLALLACECARTAIQYVRDEETAALAEACLQTVEAWAHGEATIDDVREARHAAFAAAFAAAHAAASAAHAAAYGVGGSSWNAAHLKALRAMADIVRAYYPDPPVTEVTHGR